MKNPAVKTFFLAPGVGLSAVALVIFAVVGFLLWALAGDLDDAYRQAMYESGSTKVLVREFRDYFHGRSDYPALSLEDLHRQGVISDMSWNFLQECVYSYHPFSSETSRDALVLRLGWPLVGDYFYKRDFAAGPNEPDTITK